MSQTYNDIPSTTTLTDSRQPLLDRDEAVRSAFSGSTAPSSPVLGQFWFDTTAAPGSLYQCVQISPSVIWRAIPFGSPVAIAQGGTGATSASAARTALGLGTLATKDATAIDVDLTQSSTGFLKVASGTDLQRPASPANGMIRYSTTQNTIEGYIAGSWQPVGSTTYNNKLVQRFNGTGTGANQNVALSSNPGSLNNVDVFIGGVYQQKNQLSLSGTTLTVPGAPVGTNNIEVTYGVPLSIGVPGDLTVSASKIIDAAVTNAKLATASVTVSKMANEGTTGQVLTSNGAGSPPSYQSAGGGSSFPSGTLMLFQQTSAPTGWTKQTTHDNKALRVVSGTASAGGTVAFTTAFASQSATGTVGNTTLSTAQMPSHSHTVNGLGNQSTCGGPDGGTVSINNPIGFGTTSTGGGGSHNHTFTGSAINLAVQYVDLIIASKT